MKRGKLALVLPLLAFAGIAVLALGVATGSARSHKQAAAFKAAWIYVGPHNDHGWSEAHDQGRLYVQSALGSKVETTFKENVPEGPQTCQVIESLVRDGNRAVEQPRRVFRSRRGRDLPVRNGCRRGDEEGRDRLRRPVCHSRGDPSRQRIRARRASDASRREGQAGLDERLAQPG